MLNREQLPDGRPTIAEWQVKIWNITEIPRLFKEQVCSWIKDDFSEYEFVYSPRRRTDPDSFAYLYGYGKEQILFLREEVQTGKNAGSGREIVSRTELRREQITEVWTTRELLNAEIILLYQEEEDKKKLVLPYVPSTYYLYDPFLNWILGLERDFIPSMAERENPRPKKLYHESLAMFNYSLAAYRLGNGFQDYIYRSKWHRRKWMPWKKMLEEWLQISMERGEFELHSNGYLTECFYRIRKTS